MWEDSWQSRPLQAQQASFADSKELDEIKLLLSRLDRRQDGTIDRDGFKISPATRLGSILKGYTAELDSGIRQVVSCGREIHRATEELVSGEHTGNILQSGRMFMLESA